MTLRITILVVVLVALAASWWLLQNLGMPTNLSPDVLSAWLGSQGAIGPLLLIMLMIIAVVVGPIPTLPVSATAGLAFGVVWGTAIAATGALVGAMAAFWIARSLGRDAICKRFPCNPVLAPDGSQRFLTIAILLTRLIPVFSFALISYAAGVTAIKAWRFAIATLLGMLPMTVVFAGLGNTFRLNPILTVLAGAAILAAMVWLPWSISRRPGSRLARWLQLNQ
ncbi:MAG: TVP38/TMEM64 family protein [Marinobacter sp.]|uniref:TVP38/TMEM64 family protein n=1 Tax=Marinobacter sp. TaxID=50741 RepID=UPI0029C43FF3|nr:TVP38/TMEM64 family protein [Marinobacter sp.]MDX5441726.1 TVP38/TMEM64 family protein [Alteromonadaceae bacterium]MDX5327299.1 TVP38/TMEM64 family protein [Marinobacter sp.]MDX5334817.1 TVP38/TMEM64 family protein [Marinobacter sp.]MDX5385445.1 TVP38/TMEM64 family protein [Marinobacter sp.]MDX5471085.1 TVP38/TMEM64 family protein [Marinobacter sp.]